MSKVLYLIGSLRNPRIPELAKRLRKENPDVEVFDDWFAAGPEADDYWKLYEQGRGRNYKDALRGFAARHVFDFDRTHLERATHILLVLPAGKSGHMECMYGRYGVGAETAILLDPEDIRWDVMYQFIETILESDDEIKGWLDHTEERGDTVGIDGTGVQREFPGFNGADVLAAGRGCRPGQSRYGGRAARLLSERPSRSGSPFQISWR
jgi:hypothetical protein